MLTRNKNNYTFPKKRRNVNKVLFLTIAVVLVILTFFIVSFYSESKQIIKPQIAIISIRGEISAEANRGRAVRSEDVILQLNQAIRDNSVRAVILEINSPGGSVVATREISRVVSSFDKPVVAWIRETGTSGAYWIASSSDVIVVDPATITGSIGVTSSYLEFSGLMQDYGITYESIVSGQYKDMGSPYKELSASERHILQNKINAINDLFLEQIRTHRNISESDFKRISTGEILLGFEAKELGLVDVLGGRQEAIALAENLANVRDSQLVVYTKKESLFSTLIGYLGFSLYDVGAGIGDSLNPIANSDNMLKLKV